MPDIKKDISAAREESREITQALKAKDWPADAAAKLKRRRTYLKARSIELRSERSKLIAERQTINGRLKGTAGEVQDETT
jgi:hypothetical protein